jgi:hypothetical protein
MNEGELRKRIQERLSNGTLERTYHVVAKPLTPGQTAAVAMTAGSALSDPCAVCDERGTQIRYNLQPRPVAFHERCHTIWQDEAAKPVRRA